MVSIIIPCYNVHNVVGHTLESVLSQTDSNWEIIAIDDGSIDSTDEILKKYAQLDNRINVVHQDNRGVSVARNIGIQLAKGEWIYFLDGDDLIVTDLVETINRCADTVDMFVFNFVREKDGKVTKTYKISNPETLFIDYLTNRQSIHISSIATKRNFIISNNIFFDENTSYGEDREFVAKLFTYAPIYRCIHKIAFRYQYRTDSAINTHIYSDKRFSSILATERTYILQRDPKAKRKSHAILAFTIARHLKMFYDFDSKDEKILNNLNDYSDLYLKGFHYYGIGHIELYTTIAGILAYNRNLLKLFFKLT